MRLAPALLASIALAQPAAAGGRFGNLTGWVAAGYAAGDHADTPFLAGDIDLAAPLFGSALGLDFGAYGLAFDEDTPHETYGALTLRVGPGVLAAGVVRPAYDRVADTPLDRLAPLAGFAEPRVAATRSRVTWGATYAGYLPVGVSYSGAEGGRSWSISAHRADSQDLDVAGAGLALDDAGWHLAGALEWASDGTWAGKAQLAHDGPRFSAGASAYAAPAPGFADLAEGWLTWHASGRLDLSALVQVPSGQGSTLAVLALNYALGERGRLALGLTGEGGTAAASLGLDWTF
jgi:hypothetical protein